MIQVDKISFSYGKTEILKDVSFRMGKGEFVAVLGNNGAGKSTLLSCLCKIRVPSHGSVYVEGKSMLPLSSAERARQMAFVAQKNEIHEMTVFDAVLLGRKPHMKWGVSEEDLFLCEETLERVGLSPFSLRYIHELSGGEVQKVMIARALVQNPKLLLLDEPTSSLDPKNQVEMMGLVREITKERGMGSLVVIHDINLALRYCDRFLFLKDGKVHAYGEASMVTPKIMKEVYGVESEIIHAFGRKTVLIG